MNLLSGSWPAEARHSERAGTGPEEVNGWVNWDSAAHDDQSRWVRS
jgi:hypothetical protein